MSLDDSNADLRVYTILVAGGLGSGKTTTVDNLLPELRAHLEDDQTHVTEGHFATALKQECAELAKADLQTFYTEQGKQKFLDSVCMTAGRFLQVHGEEKRQADPFHWVNLLKKQIIATAQTVGKSNVIVVVGDCRHPNEIDAMRPGFALRLNGDPGGVRARSNRDLNHPSETALNDYQNFDLVVSTDDADIQGVLFVTLNALYDADPVRFEKLTNSAWLVDRTQ